MSPKIILVTGSSTGFGRCLVEQILANGDIAVATLRKPEVLDDLTKRYPKEQLLVLPLDVTKKEQITGVFAKVKEVFGKLDVVVSNAGIAVMGEVEATPEETGRQIFDVNFWGNLEVSKQAIAFFREVNEPGKGGHFLVVSSVAGLTVVPGNGVYAASKHAVEATTEAMAKELDPAWNIKITSIQPGLFKTSILGNGGQVPPHPAYQNPALPSYQLLHGIQQYSDAYANDPVKGAKAMLKVIAMDNPPASIILGQDGYDALKAQLAPILENLEKYKDITVDVAFDKTEA